MDGAQPDAGQTLLDLLTIATAFQPGRHNPTWLPDLLALHQLTEDEVVSPEFGLLAGFIEELLRAMAVISQDEFRLHADDVHEPPKFPVWWTPSSDLVQRWPEAFAEDRLYVVVASVPGSQSVESYYILEAQRRLDQVDHGPIPVPGDELEVVVWLSGEPLTLRRTEDVPPELVGRCDLIPIAWPKEARESEATY